MNCVMTTLTILSLFNGFQWNDVEVSTDIKLVSNMNEQVISKIEILADDFKKSETITVKCGEELYAITSSVLTVE